MPSAAVASVHTKGNPVGEKARMIGVGFTQLSAHTGFCHKIGRNNDGVAVEMV
jgi:hypothetical protein